MRKALSLILAFLFIASLTVSSAAPAIAVTANDVTVPAEQNRFSVWAEDTVFDPDTDQYVDVYINISNNTDGFEYLKFFVIYPECLTLVSTRATGITTSSDLTSGIERTTPDEFFTRALMTLRGYDVGCGDEYDTPEQSAAYEARTHELLDGKKWTSPFFDCERYEYDEDVGDDVPADCYDNGRICRMRFTYDASKNPTGEDLYIELWESYEGALHSSYPDPAHPEWADEWAYYDADNYGCVVDLPDVSPITNDPTFTVSDAAIEQGDPTATFDITVSNNPGIWSTQLWVVYYNKMTYNSFENGELFPDSALPMSPANSPYMRDQVPADKFAQIAWKNLRAAFEAAGVPYENKLGTIVQYENPAFDDITANGRLFSLTLNTSTLPAGEYDICIVYLPNNTINAYYDNVTFAVVQGKLTVSGGNCEHRDTENITVSYPTCTEAGMYDVKCSLCGETLEAGIEIPALGHDYNTTVIAPTCTADGCTMHTCSRCGDTYYTDTVPALGHKLSSSFTIEEQPTLDTPGVKSCNCRRGGETVYSDLIYLLCDINGDEKIDNKDTKLLSNYLKGVADNDEIVLINADINNDGRIDNKDQKLLNNYLKGQITYEDLLDVHGDND